MVTRQAGQLTGGDSLNQRAIFLGMMALYAVWHAVAEWSPAPLLIGLVLYLLLRVYLPPSD
jgi:hypothetical protein